MENNLSKSCPTCESIMTYESVITLKRGVMNDSKCPSCRSIFRKNNIISDIKEVITKDYSAGELIRFIFEFPANERNEVARKIMELRNPTMNYEISGKLSSRNCRVRWNCQLHPEYLSSTTFRSIVEKKQICTMCMGQNPPNTWTKENLYKKIEELVLRVYEQTNCTFNCVSYFEWDSKLLNAWFKKINNPSQEFYLIIAKLGLPSPQDNVYLKDGNMFRGFYEFVGYLLINHWSVPFEYSPKVFGNYISDGFFPEINTFWEHWGELNKNNKHKKDLYSSNQYNLFETFDKDCQRKGITYLYKKLRTFLTQHGYDIPIMTHSEVLGIIKGNMSDFQNTMNTILTYIVDLNLSDRIVETELRKTKQGNYILAFINKFFDGSILKFKKYLNENHGFSYQNTAFRGSYKNYDYFVEQITPFIKQYGKIPKQMFFEKNRRNDITVMATRMFGGLNNLKRNKIEEGLFFYLVKDLYEIDPPYDRDLVWDGDKNYHNIVIKVIDHFKDKSIPFPSKMNNLRYNDEYNDEFIPYGKQLHSAISRNGGWDMFVTKYKSVWDK
jgi:hypothetical protein